MPLDQSYVGRVYPPSPEFEVGREKIREFADAIGEPDPLHRDPAAARAAGYADVIAPLTFTTVLNLRAINEIVADPQLGLDYGRMVHGDQSFEYHSPVVAGDRLVTTASVEAIMHRAGSDFITLRAEITTTGGEPRVTARAQLVVRAAEEG